MFRLFKIVTFLGSVAKLSLSFTLASRLLLIWSPIELEYLFEGNPKKLSSNLVYSAVFPSASIIYVS